MGELEYNGQMDQIGKRELDITLLKESLKHWRKMHLAASQFIQKDAPDYSLLTKRAGSGWGEEGCALCASYRNSTGCRGCPLFSRYWCDASYSPWRKVHVSQTWAEWVRAADDMIDAIEKTLEKLEETKGTIRRNK